MNRWRTVLILILVPLGSCGKKGLEVRGALNRVVGETVSLALVAGNPNFAGDLSLKAADSTSYNSASLHLAVNDDRNLSFVIPSGISTGKAVAQVAQASGGTYEVPLQVSRLVLALADKNTLEFLPLPGGTLSQPTALDLGTSKSLMALAPGGGTLATYAGEEVRVRSLGQEIKDWSTGIKQPGGSAMVALPDGGVLIATDAVVNLLRFAKDQQPRLASSKPLSGCKALTASASGALALALSTCDANNDKQNEDCVTLIHIAANDLTLDNPLSLNTTPSASIVDMTTDGKGAVILDNDSIYGVWLEDAPKITTKMAWSLAGQPFKAQPVALDHAIVPCIGKDLPTSNIDIFAAMEKEKNLVAFLAFKPDGTNPLQFLSTSTILTEKPSSLSFGRQADLYIALGTKVVTLNACSPNPQPASVEINPANAIVNLIVQP